MSEVIIIAAVAKNGVIGNGNQIPWHIKNDFRRFKKITTGFPIIMGRKTYESLPVKPLPCRTNIVVSSKCGLKYSGAIVAASLDKALEFAKNEAKIFVIGGGEIYEQAITHADRLELTLLDKEYEGDTFFPEINPNEWLLTNEERHNGYSFNTYVRATYPA